MNSPRHVKTRIGNLTMTRPVMVGTSEAGMAAYYVFTNSESTLFVSADDVAVPVLGYTDKGDFDPDNMPPQLRWWLDQYASQIEWATQHGVTYTPGPATLNADAIEPMLTTEWDQSYPYNAYCPLYDGYRTVAGCVAISVAQTMNYFKWPKNEIPSISYEWNNQKLTTDPFTIDWDNMVDNYISGYTDKQRDAVAKLVQAVGYALHTDYNTSYDGGSGAYSQAIAPAMVDLFGYDAAITYYYRDYFEDDVWEQMMYDNLVNCGPVIYDGQGDAGRHSFVCDGYDGAGKYHFNFGWGGVSDGYYALSAINPPALGIGGGNGGFNYFQGAVFGIRPPQADTKPAEGYIICNGSLDASFSGKLMTLSSPDSGFYNYGTLTDDFTFGAMIQNLGTGDIDYLESVTIDLELYSGITYYSVRFSPDIVNGLYKVTTCTKIGDGDWRPILFLPDQTDYVNVKIADGTGTLDTTVAENPEVAITNWSLTRGFVSGEQYMMIVRVTNSYIVSKDCDLNISLCKLEGDDYVRIADLGTKSMTIQAFEEARVRYSGTLENIEPGTYYIVFENGTELMLAEKVEVAPGEGDVPGSVDTIQIDDLGDMVIYDLNGRLVTGRPAPGLYIINGRKALLR